MVCLVAGPENTFQNRSGSEEIGKRWRRERRENKVGKSIEETLRKEGCVYKASYTQADQ